MTFSILNTRPLQQNQAMTQYIEHELNAQCIELPLLEITPINSKHWPLPASFQKIDLIVFTSPNAVKHSINILKNYFPLMPSIAAIGPATTIALAKNGLEVDIIAEKSNSESLVAHKKLQNINGQNVIIVKGQRGRNLLQTFFLQQKSNLFELNVYKRDCPKLLANNLKKIWQNHAIDLILIHSVEALTFLVKQADELTRQKIQQTPCLALSNRIMQAAVNAGLQHVFVASNCQMEQSIKEYMTYRKIL